MSIRFVVNAFIDMHAEIVDAPVYVHTTRNVCTYTKCVGVSTHMDWKIYSMVFQGEGITKALSAANNNIIVVSCRKAQRRHHLIIGMHGYAQLGTYLALTMECRSQNDGKKRAKKKKEDVPSLSGGSSRSSSKYVSSASIDPNVAMLAAASGDRRSRRGNQR